MRKTTWMIAGSMMLASAATAEAADMVRRYPLSDFDGVAIGGAVRAEVREGARFSVSAAGEAPDLDRYEAYIRDGKLHFQPRRGLSPYRQRRPVALSVTLPRLRSVGMGGSGTIHADRVRGDSVQLSVGGSGAIKVDAVEADGASVAIGGSGSVTARGHARSVQLSIAGSGDADLAALRSAEARVSVAGSGDAAVHASRTASVSIMGSGGVRVTGGARCTVSRMGSGKVSC